MNTSFLFLMVLVFIRGGEGTQDSLSNTGVSEPLIGSTKTPTNTSLTETESALTTRSPSVGTTNASSQVKAEETATEFTNGNTNKLPKNVTVTPLENSTHTWSNTSTSKITSQPTTDTVLTTTYKTTETPSSTQTKEIVHTEITTIATTTPTKEVPSKEANPELSTKQSTSSPVTTKLTPMTRTARPIEWTDWEGDWRKLCCSGQNVTKYIQTRTCTGGTPEECPKDEFKSLTTREIECPLCAINTGGRNTLFQGACAWIFLWTLLLRLL